MLKKILLISFLFIPVGILIGYFVDQLQFKRIERQSEKTLQQLNQSMKDLDELEGQLDSLQGQELPFDTNEPNP